MLQPTTRKLKAKTKPTGATCLPIPAGNLWVHEVTSRIFGNTRLLRVWLPPDYDGWGETRYPVLYTKTAVNDAIATDLRGDRHIRWVRGFDGSCLPPPKIPLKTPATPPCPSETNVYR